MIEGDVALTRLPQADGGTKPRPVILLRQLPPFGDWLLCGVSAQIQQEVHGFDDRIDPEDSDYVLSGLKTTSLIRLGFLAVLPVDHLLGAVGAISPERHERLLRRLGTFLQAPRTA